MIPHFKGNIPFVDIDQMQEVNRLMTEEYGISQQQMMENAGLNLAILAKEIFLDNQPEGKKILIAAGPGSNGGGAMVAARRLKIWGADVSLMLSATKGKFRKETIYQFSILQKLGIETTDKVPACDLIVDGMINYDFNNGNPDNKAAARIRMINDTETPVLSLDAPSGLDLSTGKPGDPTIKAHSTMTLALPKLGLFKLKASKFIGDLYLADISVPPDIFKTLGLQVNGLAKAFNEHTVVRINKVVVFNV